MKSKKNILVAIFLFVLFACENKNSSQEIEKKREYTQDWSTLKKVEVKYLQLNFSNLPDSLASSIMNFKSFDSAKILSSSEKLMLENFINDSTNFSETDCTTFGLNAGFIVFEKGQVNGYIDIGCGYNQWFFNPENKLSKTGGLTSKGFKEMSNILDSINLRK